MRRDVQELEGLVLLTSPRFADERGALVRGWSSTDLQAAGIAADFRQGIQTSSRRGVLRGLHFQWAPPMGKLVRCARGAVFDVVVDVRHGSLTLGDHAAVELTEENGAALWVPPGFAHGVFARENDSLLLYECSADYDPAGEAGIRWDDPALAIRWPDESPIVSERDCTAPTLEEWLADPRSRAFRV